MHTHQTHLDLQEEKKNFGNIMKLNFKKGDDQFEHSWHPCDYDE